MGVDELKINEQRRQYLVTIVAFDLAEGTATFADDGWMLSVKQDNLRDAVTGLQVGECVMISVVVRYDNLPNPYRLTAVHRFKKYWEDSDVGTN